MERAIICPQCNSPLSPHPFARSIVCEYCGSTIQLDETSVSSSDFHKTFLTWNSPDSYLVSNWISLDQRRWALEKRVAQNEFFDIYTGRLARWPTELVLIKLLRNERDLPFFENEWKTIQELNQSKAVGADFFSSLLPQPVIHGAINSGSFIGRHASIFRWESGFRHSFNEVIQAYPQGISPRASIWVWRRILEMLHFIHNSGFVHGAIVPSNLLVQENDHGVRLVGYTFAGRIGEKVKTDPQIFSPFHPGNPHLTKQLDLLMSARCITAILCGDPATGSLPKAVPAKLSAIIRRYALLDPEKPSLEDAWSIREELGQISNETFGPAEFIPINMPPHN